MHIEASTLEFVSINQPPPLIENAATAIIWLKQNELEKQKKLAQFLRAMDGIIQVKQRDNKPNILHVDFDYDQIRYAEIISEINQFGFGARIVGY